MSSTRYTCIALIILASGVIYYVMSRPQVKLQNHAKSMREHYDPQDMGGRKFWGFGREYGYAQRDMDHPAQVCYQISSRHLCREGYSRKINPVTLGDECCANSFVYGN